MHNFNIYTFKKMILVFINFTHFTLQCNVMFYNSLPTINKDFIVLSNLNQCLKILLKCAKLMNNRKVEDQVENLNEVF